MSKSAWLNRKRMPIILLAVLILIAAGGACYYFVSLHSRIDPLMIYQNATAQRGAVSRTITGEGTIEERERFELFVKQAQKVASIMVEQGDVVEKGQPLVRYDIADDLLELERQMSEAKLYLENARLSLENIARPATGNLLIQYEAEVTAAEKSMADINSEIDSLASQIIQQRLRVDNLKKLAGIYEDDYDDNLIDEEDYDTARTNYLVAMAALSELNIQMDAKEITQQIRKKQVDDAKKKLDNALNPLKDPVTSSKYQIQQNIVSIHELTVDRLADDMEKLTTETLSPVAGLITDITITEGVIASAYLPIIEVADLSGPVIRFEAGEYDAPQLLNGQRALITFSGISEVPYEGAVTKIGARAEVKEDSGEDEIIVPVEITLSEEDERLRVGYTVNVEIVVEEQKNVLSVPIRAIVSEGGKSYLYLVRDGAIIKQAVTSGFYGDRSVEITAGLTDGDVYISNPLDVKESHIRD